MRKRIYAVLLASALTVASINPAYAAEFGDGTEQMEMTEENSPTQKEEETGELFDSGEEAEADLFLSKDEESADSVLKMRDENLYIDMGSARVGYTSSELTGNSEYLENSGDTPLHLQDVKSKYFNVRFDDQTIPANGTVWLYMIPKTGLKQGKYQETIKLRTEEGQEVSLEAVFSVGAQVKQKKAILLDSREITINFYKDKYEEGDYYEEPEEVEWAYLYITNIGTTTVNLNLSKLQYLVTEDSITLEPGEQKEINFKAGFLHLYAGEYQETLHITDDTGAIQEDVSCKISVKGPRKLFTVDKEKMTFKRVQDEKVKEELISVTNHTAEPHALAIKRVYGSEAFEISGLSKDMLNPGETATFTVSPKKDAQKGRYYETLKLCADGGETDYQNIQLSMEVYPKITKLVYGDEEKGIEITKRYGITKERLNDYLAMEAVIMELSDGSVVYPKVSWDWESCPYNPSDKKEQTFEVYGTVTIPAKTGNPDGISLEVPAKIRILAYEPMKRPEIFTNYISGNSAEVILKEYVEEAEGYEFVLSTRKDFLKSQKFSRKEQVLKNVDTFGEIEIPRKDFRNLKAGHYYSACRAYKTEKGKKIYTKWSGVKEFDIKKGKPATPVIKKVTISGNKVTVSVGNIAKNDRYQCILGTKAENGVPIRGKGMSFTQKGSFTVTFESVPAGNYYLGLQSWHEQEDGTYFSDWSKIRKMTVSAKSPARVNMEVCKVSGKKLTVKIPVPGTAEGYEIAVGTSAKKTGYTGTYAYAPTNIRYSKTAKIKKGQKQVTVTFTNMKPGEYYYVGARTYRTENNKKLYSRWSSYGTVRVK
ncbi:MAG: hypothetical protein Q4C91_15985 [Eubacteriales bacterium]|nr:hypothetical protein [Eubacteriales bacterium]